MVCGRPMACKHIPLKLPMAQALLCTTPTLSVAYPFLPMLRLPWAGCVVHWLTQEWPACLTGWRACVALGGRRQLRVVAPNHLMAKRYEAGEEMFDRAATAVTA
jgi:hypothetical protein